LAKLNHDLETVPYNITLTNTSHQSAFKYDIKSRKYKKRKGNLSKKKSKKIACVQQYLNDKEFYEKWKEKIYQI